MSYYQTITARIGPISTSMNVGALDYEGKKTLDSFLSSLTVYDYMNRKKLTDSTGKTYMGPAPVKTRYYIMKEGVLYLPNPTAERLFIILESRSIRVDKRVLHDSDIEHITLDIHPSIKLYPIQEEAIRRIEGFLDRAALLSLQPGGGKALTLDTPVPTPEGFTKHGDLKVGDYVIGSDGKPTKVIGYFPQPVADIYRVEFVDGTHLDSCSDHLWDVYDSNTDERVVINSLNLYRTDHLVNIDQECRYTLPKHKGWLGGSNDPLPLEPQQLAAVLSTARTDEDMYIKELKGLRLYGISKKYLYIPEMYLISTYENRQRLFQGLINDQDDLVFTTTSKSLKNNILQLGRSLGYELSSFSSKDEDKIWYVYKVVTGKGITKVTKLEKQGATSCIAVDAKDKLYMAGKHYSLTHNTFTSIVLASRRGYRLMVFGKSGYMDQWAGEIDAVLETDNVVKISGTDTLLKLLNNPGDDLPDVVIISLSTYRSYVKRWLNGDERINISPLDLVGILKIGTIIADECHKELHSLWTLMSLSNPDMLLGLSGTMSTDEPKDAQAQADMFPYRSRFTEGDLKPYVDLVIYTYHLLNPKYTVYSHRGRTTYSHVAYEKWIIKSAWRRDLYLGLIGDAFEEYYLNDKKEGDRCMIFVELIKLSHYVVNYLNRRFYQYNLKYINFTGSLKKEDCIGKDVIVTTIGKSGTSLDFIGLTRLINTVAVSKKETAQQNIQRLRRPKNKVIDKYRPGYMDDRQRLCVQFHTGDIDKHNTYLHNRNRSIEKLISSKKVVHKDVKI